MGVIYRAEIRESSEVIKAAAGGQPDRAKLAEIMGRHGLTPAPHAGGF